MSSVHDLNQPVVLDLGSGLTKGGYAGTPDPSVVIGTLTGHAKLQRVLPSATAAPDMPGTPDGSRGKYGEATSSGGSVFVGEQLRNMCGVLRLEHAMQRGMVTDWSGAEEIWRHVSTDLLSVAHGEHPFLVTENALNARWNRERMGEFFFESLNAPSLCVAVPGVLSLYASGRTSGLVVDVGDTLTTTMAVADGHVDVHAMRRSEVGGRDVTERLGTLLQKSGVSLMGTSSEREAVRRVKERLCYIAEDAREEERRFIDEGVGGGKLGASFRLPDGNVLQVGTERFRAGEIVFRPHLMGAEVDGVAQSVHSCTQAVDMHLRRALYGSVLLSGGSTLLRGFCTRLLREVRALAPSNCKIRIHAPTDRLYSAFTGGSVLACLSTTFRSMAVSRSEYFEHGAGVLHHKCL
ncbi:Centractin [Gracilariopsis chorda]|uniref:Centractin n=1 Tax=Gracilariopsis chorda TaxID=448386 RepID=A0A2V3J4A3_9FLOR|nr:Centractin [Gracilariopsis chorda]|eukprot:PXF49248.1 Centractin [Gracilariopsis chorda]